MRSRTELVSLVLLVGAIVVVGAAPASAHVRSTTGRLPDGDQRPQIHAVELRAPQRHNNLLEADLVIDATDNDGIARFEYRWNSATYGSIRSTTTELPTVDYSSTRPDSRFALEVRAIDVNNNASEWFPAWHGTTPSVPRIVVAGDSIASGYTKRWFLADGVCRDNALSYGSTLTDTVNGSLPEQWKATYTNIAWAGANVGNMVSGGTDSCGIQHRSQVAQIQGLLDATTWNVVIVTAGINSTNWTDVIVGLTRDTAFSFTEEGDRAACNLAVSDSWNVVSQRDRIRRSTRTISTTLLDTTNARLMWTGYYNFTGSQLAPGWTPIGAECEEYMTDALDELHGALRSGLDPRAEWLDIDRNVATQSWAGWPHPSAEGHRTIGLAVSAAILDDR